MWALSTCGEPNDIGVTAAHISFYRSLSFPFQICSRCCAVRTVRLPLVVRRPGLFSFGRTRLQDKKHTKEPKDAKYRRGKGKGKQTKRQARHAKGTGKGKGKGRGSCGRADEGAGEGDEGLGLGRGRAGTTAVRVVSPPLSPR